MPRLPALILVLGVFALPALAAASPFEDVMTGGAVFTGPTEPNATAIQLNPAALGLGHRGWHLFAAGTGQFDRYAISRNRISTTGSVITTDDSTPQTLAPGGTASIYLVFPDISVGFAATTVFSESFIENEPSLAYHTSGGVHRQLAFSPVVAFRLHSRFFFGATVSFTQTALSLEYANDTALTAGSDPNRGISSPCGGDVCGFEHPDATEIYSLEVSSDSVLSNVALNIGFMFRFTGEWWLGAAYQSPPGFLSPMTLDGIAEIEQAPRDGGNTSKRFAEVKYNLPQKILLGVRGPAFSRFDVVASAQWQNLSRHDVFDIRTFRDGNSPEWQPRYRGFNDVFTLQAGLEQDTYRVLRFGARLRFETGAVDETKTTALQIAGMNVGIGTGAELRIADRFTLGVAYGFTYFPTATATNSVFDPLAHVDCVDSNYSFDTCAATREGRGLPTASGTYDRYSHNVRISADISLW